MWGEAVELKDLIHYPNSLHVSKPDKLQLSDQALGGMSLTGGVLGGVSNMVRTDTAVLDKRYVCYRAISWQDRRIHNEKH